MATIIRPFLYRLAFSGSARGYTRRIDDYIDIQILGSLDRALPQVKTLRMRDIRDFLTSPFVRIYTFSRLRIDDSIDATDRMVIKPTRRAIHDVRANISGEIGELSAAGGPFIRSRIDPMVKPLNENMIRYINETFPEDPLHSGELGERTNELSYALRIVNGEINRSRNLATKRIEGIREIPASTLKRMAEVYRDNQKKRGDNGDSRVVMMIASLDTARTLAAEGYQIVFATNGEDK
ncbi:DEKNAAC101459 [Brettanomyces naardenensis]|uniref:DEKNAAC101460 n=1 Tax=Brettanomyces naardenensis TaxID=13370 RepID=A0A448YIC2_BRENA|nr:DEKNAAC101459 [Brettanomyces naardenensis]